MRHWTERSKKTVKTNKARTWETFGVIHQLRFFFSLSRMSSHLAVSLCQSASRIFPLITNFKLGLHLRLLSSIGQSHEV